jgi:toxin FitB
MSFLLDTNVISEVRKRTPNRNVLIWYRSVEREELYLSAMVVGEIRQGIERIRRHDPLQAGMLDPWLRQLHVDFRDRIIPVTSAIAEEWGLLNAGRTLPFVDGILAATAITLNLTLATRNTRDVAGTGVPLLNPFEPGT